MTLSGTGGRNTKLGAEETSTVSENPLFLTASVADGGHAALKHPTNPDSADQSSASSTHLDPPLAHSLPANLLTAANGALTPSGGSGFGGGQGGLGGSNYEGTNYDFFDPQHWMLDGLMDFNYSFVPEMGA